MLHRGRHSWSMTSSQWEQICGQGPGGDVENISHSWWSYHSISPSHTARVLSHWLLGNNDGWTGTSFQTHTVADAAIGRPLHFSTKDQQFPFAQESDYSVCTVATYWVHERGCDSWLQSLMLRSRGSIELQKQSPHLRVTLSNPEQISIAWCQSIFTLLAHDGNHCNANIEAI